MYDSPGNNVRVERSVIAGVKRNSVSFSEIESLYQGASLVKEIPSVFYKNLNNLNIKINTARVTIDFSPDKKLINNNYIPQTIYQVDSPNLKQNFINRLLKKMIFMIKLKLSNGSKNDK